jgi:hypothetical protein
VDSLYDDIDELRPKRAKQVIEEILQTYGATLRYDNGTWWILQPENINSTNVSTTYFQKDGTSLGAFSVANTYTIDTGGYKTNDVIVNMYLPSLYGVGLTYDGESQWSWARNESISTGRKNYTLELGSYGTLDANFNIEFSFTPAGTGAYRMFVVPRCGDWVYLYQRLRKEYFWWYMPTGTPLPYASDYIFTEISNPSGGEQSVSFGFNILKPTISAARGGSDSIVFDTTLIRYNSSTQEPWTSKKHEVNVLTQGDKRFTLSYLANNSIYNATSMFEEVKSAYCDNQQQFTLGGLYSFDGTDWVQSSEWASGTSATSGESILELLAQKCIYWQRYPRLLIQGTLLLPEYNSVNTLIWRGTRFMMMNGTFDARTRSWNGVWVEMLEQTSDVVVASRNPYRNPLLQASDNGDFNWGQISRLGNQLQNLQGQVFELISKVNDLKLKSDAGLEQQLIQNIQGVETSMSIGEKQPLQITKTSTGYKLEYGTVG